MAHKYDATRTYRLNKVTQSNSTVADSSFEDLSTTDKIYDMMVAAQSEQAAATSESDARLVNYAYYVIREKITEAANAGLSYVDLTWQTLLQQYSTSTLIQFLRLTIDDEGHYAAWSNAQTPPAGSPWKQIMSEINASSGAKNKFSVSYSYKKNETVPYGVRLSWADKNYADNDTNTDWAADQAAHPRFIIKENANTLTDASFATTALSTGATSQLSLITRFIDICNRQIENAISSNLNYAEITWSDFGNSYKSTMISMLGISEDLKTYTSSHKITCPQSFTVYYNEISASATSRTYAANTAFALISILTNASYKVGYLKHAANSTYDGLVIAWTDDATNIVSARKTAYTTATTTPTADTTIYVPAATGAEMKAQDHAIAIAMNTKHVQTLASHLSQGLVSAFNSGVNATPILWSHIDSSLPKTVYKHWSRESGTLKFTSDIVKLDKNNQPVPTAKVPASGVKDLLAALTNLFGTFQQKSHTVTVNKPENGKTSENVSVTVSAASLSSDTVFYWDYLYYANHYATNSPKDGKNVWTKKATPSGDPCGIVVQVGTTSDYMDNIIKEYAETQAPK